MQWVYYYLLTTKVAGYCNGVARARGGFMRRWLIDGGDTNKEKEQNASAWNHLDISSTEY
jgi:hypothetical protein